MTVGGLSFPANLGDKLRNYQRRIAYLENSDGSNPWIYVGTAGVDGVDALLTPDSPPFQNLWSNTGEPQAPVSFKRFLNWVHIRGGFYGGSQNTVVFTLPESYRPAYFTPMVVPTGDGTSVSVVAVDIDGTVTFIQ